MKALERIGLIVPSIAAFLATATLLGALGTSANAQAPRQPRVEPGVASPETGRPTSPATKNVDGTVARVDPATQTVDIAWGLFGLFGTTLRITEATEIRVGDRAASIAELQEGARVRAAYETRGGENIARSIDVVS